MMSTASRCYVVAGCLLAAALYLTKASQAEVLPPRESLAVLPVQFDGWKGYKGGDLTPSERAVLGVDDYIFRNYYRTGDATAVGLYIGYYESQRQGDAIHSPLNCLPGAGWLPDKDGRQVIPVQVSATPGAPATTPIEINRVVIEKGLDRQLVLYWYQSHRRVVASEYWGKVYSVLDSVRYNRTDAALVRVVAPIGPGKSTTEAEAQAVAFVQSLFPLLGRHLPT